MSGLLFWLHVLAYGALRAGNPLFRDGIRTGSNLLSQHDLFREPRQAFGDHALTRANQPEKPWYVVRVVGVVENVKQWGATYEVQPEMYTVPEGHWGHSAFLVLRTPLPIGQLAPQLRRAFLDRFYSAVDR